MLITQAHGITIYLSALGPTDTRGRIMTHAQCCRTCGADCDIAPEKHPAAVAQAYQSDYEGHTIYRWFIWINGVRLVTWARSEHDARIKRPGITRVEPAPPAIDAAVALGKLGGLSTSEAKREAARRNGAKGGRPRKQPPPVEPETTPEGGSLTQK